jgi:hypothetical protein
MRKTSLALALALTASAAAAQVTAPRTPELRTFVGAAFQTGPQRDVLKDAFLVGAQGAVQVRPAFHLVGSFGWMPTVAKYAVADDNVNVFQYDLGMEFGLLRATPGGFEVRPFLGLGGGARTYLYDAKALNDNTCSLGYATLGTEFLVGPAMLRMEGRDNVFCFKSPVGNKSKTRNDVGLTVGVGYHF